RDPAYFSPVSPSADRGGYLFNDLIDDLTDEGVIYPLAHDADQRLGSRFPDQQPAFRAKALLTLRDHPLHLLRQQRIGAFEADVFQDLRERIEIVADLADRPSLLDNYREDLQRREQPIARSAVIGEDNMPRLLAADIEAIFPHMLNHIAIADGGAGKGEAVAGEIFLKPHVGHDRRHNAAALQLLALLPGAGDQRHQLVAVDQPPLLIADQQPVRIAIERDAEIGALGHHPRAHRLRRGGAAAVIDVEAVGRDAHGDYLRLQLPEHRRRHLVGRAVGAIDNDF